MVNYIDEMYLQWKKDFQSVYILWQVYFKNMESGDMFIFRVFIFFLFFVLSSNQIVVNLVVGVGVGIGEGIDVINYFKVQFFVCVYQVCGYYKVKIDFLGICNVNKFGFGNIRFKEFEFDYY